MPYKFAAYSKKKIAKIKKRNYEKIERKLDLNKFIRNNHHLEYDKETNELVFGAPDNFSIMDNPEISINYFNEILNIINKRHHYKIFINFDLIYVTKISIDAIMYMLALIKNTKVFFKAKGNCPIDLSAKKAIIESGFLNYVYHNNDLEITRSKNHIQIRIDNNSNDNRIHCKAINLRLMSKYNLKQHQLHFLYDILSEMMINTNEHAYNNTSQLLSNWYVYVAMEEDKIKFSFLDTGEGIPGTIRKNYSNIIEHLNIKDDSEIIAAALGGKLRTYRKQIYGGKGLLKFTKYNKMDKLENFKIVSGRGCAFYNNKAHRYNKLNLNEKLIGTVYYFEININKIREGIHD